MIIFDRLQISDNGKLLYLSAHVNKASLFNNIYIDKVIIQTSEQVSETDPLSPGDSFVYQQTVADSTKELNLALDVNTDFDGISGTLSNKLLFVYVICKGIPDQCTPCRLDEMTTLGVTFDEALLYQKIMQFTKQLTQKCEIPKNFIDLILLWNGFKSAIETEHYLAAIDFWKKLFNSNTLITSKSCGCHG